jgi:hypothetical protein
MEPPTLHPTLLRYLRTVQRSTNIGFGEVFRYERPGPSERTAYRWRQSLGHRLHIMPSITTEALGLLHAHALLPTKDLTELPYVVEASSVTLDLVRRFRYVHLLVPTVHKDHVNRLLDRLQARYRTWSSSGWQQFPASEERLSVPQGCPPNCDDDLLRKHPLLVPVVIETYRYPNTMPQIWQRIREQLGPLVRQYVRGRVLQFNGKAHVHRSYHVLQERKLVQQHVIRYQALVAANIEVFLEVRGTADEVLGFLEGLRDAVHAIETYAIADGYLVRLLGHYELLDRVMTLPTGSYEYVRMLGINTKRHLTPTVTFDYRRLFNPKTGTWHPPES